jgi:S-sulfosulfanyl-L-cysteine sulfohydrolase
LSRISDMRLKGKAIEAGRSYKLASWAPVAEGASGEPVWDVVTRYLRARKVIKPPVLNRPRVIGVDGNPGIAG